MRIRSAAPGKNQRRTIDRDRWLWYTKTEKQLELLASDGMLVKRPLLVGENVVLIGFKEPEWKEKLEK